VPDPPAVRQGARGNLGDRVGASVIPGFSAGRGSDVAGGGRQVCFVKEGVLEPLARRDART
jgi:hypothetical protein